MDIARLSLRDLRSRLESQVSQGNLVLAVGVLKEAKLTGFLNTLPDKRITLTDPVFDLADATWPARLTITGQVTARWPVSAFTDGTLDVGSCVVRISREHSDAPAVLDIDVVGTVRVKTLRLPVRGSVVDDDLLRCSPQPGTHPAPHLVELVGHLSNSVVSVALPEDVPFAGALTLGEIDLLVGFGRPPRTSLVLGLDSTTHWPVIENEFVLESVGVRLVVTHSVPPGGPANVTFSGSLHARLTVGREFTVTLFFGAGDQWELAVVPADGALPSLADLAFLIGKESLRDSVQAGLDTLRLGELGIDGVRIGFDPFARQLRHIVLACHITLAGVRLDLTAQLPRFRFGGRLAHGTTIRLKRLIEHFFATADGFPDLVITELGFSAYPGASTYELSMTAEDDAFTIGPIKFQQVIIDIAKEGTGYRGEIQAGIMLGGAYLVISAGKAESGGVWVFSGQTGPGQTLSVATLHADLAAKFDNDFTLPAVIQDLLIDNLVVRFDTGGNFTFTCHTRFPISDSTTVDLTVFIDVISHQNAKSDITLRAAIAIGDLNFEVDFARTGTGTALLAAYTAQPKRTARKVRDLLAPVLAGLPELAALVPDSLEIELKDAFFFLRKQNPPAPARFLFGLDLGVGMDLAQLPLVGRQLPAGHRLGVDDLQIIVASEAFTPEDVTAVNGMLLPGATRLPSGSAGGTGPALARGVTFGATLSLGGEPYPLTLPAPIGPGTLPAPTSPPVGGAPVVASDTAQWITLQRTFGPLHFNRVGFQYQNEKLWFLLDASISIGGLTFALDGLAVGSAVKRFTPEFDLRGVGLDYTSGPLAVGGSLLRVQVTGTDGKPYDEYECSALLRIRELALSAIGAYAYVSGYPSLFVYAVLDYPIGGPSFFFVTGMTAGFGYNRRLRLPGIDQVAQFPLISEVMTDGGPAPTTDPLAELAKLRAYVVPAEGELFLAVGVRFTSFKQIDSFALLTLLFGQRFEVDVLGMSTMKLPTTPGAPPLAEVRMAVKASFVPDEGFLGVQAQLTSASYLFSRDCHLTGGFAFFTWFTGEHGGDFVVTVGGYRPGYTPPAHYPLVPRLGFNWQVDRELSVKGDAYFALVPSALMAGGHLQANWASGNLSASFAAGVDFLVAWQPYHYEAAMYVHFGVHYTYHFFGTHTISVDVGADLSIWGPEFSGKARVHLSVVSFEISFGSGAARRPDPLDWSAFHRSFLPTDTGEQTICTLVVRDGLVRDGDQGIDWVLSPKRFTIVTDSAVPAKHYDVHSGTVDRVASNGSFGIAPMDVAAARFDSTHTVTITRDGKDVTQLFSFSAVLKRVPKALWGESVSPRADADALVADTLAGFAISPLAPVQPAEDPPETVTDAEAKYSPVRISGAFAWQDPLFFVSAPDQGRAAAGRALGASGARDALLADLGIIGDITVDASTASAFLVVPEVGTLLEVVS